MTSSGNRWIPIKNVDFPRFPSPLGRRLGRKNFFQNPKSVENAVLFRAAFSTFSTPRNRKLQLDHDNSPLISKIQAEISTKKTSGKSRSVPLPAGNCLLQFFKRICQQPAEDTGEDPPRIPDPFRRSRICPTPVGQDSLPLPFALRRADRTACRRIRVCIHEIPPYRIKIRKIVQTSREDLTNFRNVRTPCIRFSAPWGADSLYHLFCQSSTKSPMKPLSAGIFLTLFISLYAFPYISQVPSGNTFQSLHALILSDPRIFPENEMLWNLKSKL